MHSLLADPNSDYVNANYIDVSSSFFPPQFILCTILFLSFFLSYFLSDVFFPLEMIAVEECHAFLLPFFDFDYSDAQEACI